MDDVVGMEKRHALRHVVRHGHDTNEVGRFAVCEKKALLPNERVERPQVAELLHQVEFVHRRVLALNVETNRHASTRSAAARLRHRH